MKEYVVGFAFDRHEARVALIVKNRPTWQAGKLNGIGGKVEPREAPLQAMEREFAEEAGGEADWQLFATLEGRDDSARLSDPEPFRVWFFRGTTTDSLKSATDERIVWIDPGWLPWNVLPNLRWLIPMARSNQTHDWPFRIVERAHEVA